MLLLEVVEPVAFDAPHLSHPPMFFLFNARPGRPWFSGRWKAAYLGGVTLISRPGLRLLCLPLQRPCAM